MMKLWEDFSFTPELYSLYEIVAKKQSSKFAVNEENIVDQKKNWATIKNVKNYVTWIESALEMLAVLVIKRVGANSLSAVIKISKLSSI